MLGLIGCWIALPPITARSWVWSLVVCLIAVMLGIGVADPRRASIRWFRDRIGRARVHRRLPRDALERRQARDRRRLVCALRGDAPVRDAAGLRCDRRHVLRALRASSNIGLEGMMLIGAFFGILGADKLGTWWLGLLIGDRRGGLFGAAPRRALDPPARGPDHRRHGDQLPRARAHRLPVHRHLRRTGHADRHLRASRTCTSASSTASRSSTSIFGESQPDDLGRARPRPARPGSSSSRRRSACASGPSASIRGGRHGRHLRLRDPLRRRRPLRHARGGRRRIPVDRLRQLVQREHDRGPRVHRARGA